MTPIPHTAMAEPCFSLGLMSMSTTCANGTKAAPKTPCSSRAATICAREFDMPHSAEATVKPEIEARNMCFWPKRSQSQPVRGVAMADATMYAVNTQAIWSCEADSVPCMCGKATLAMVLSSVCMIVANMIDRVIMGRLSGRSMVRRLSGRLHVQEYSHGFLGLDDSAQALEKFGGDEEFFGVHVREQFLAQCGAFGFDFFVDLQARRREHDALDAPIGG